MFWNPKFWKVFVFWNFVFLVIKCPVSVVTGCLGFLVFYCFIILLLCLVLSSDNLGSPFFFGFFFVFRVYF